MTISDSASAAPVRISDVVRPWADCAPNHPALVESGGTWTYRQLASAIAKTRTRLSESGVRAGDRVLIVGENCREFVALLLGAAALDAWPVLVNAHLSAREVDQISAHCGARRVFYTTRVSPNAAEHAARRQASVEELDGVGSFAV